MMTGAVLTPWFTTPEGLNFPKVLIDYPGISGYKDVTNQAKEEIMPTPNLFLAEITCSAAVMAAIEADANYLVVWSV